MKKIARQFARLRQRLLTTEKGPPMLADLLPRWAWRLLKLDNATLPTAHWSWQHTMRYGRDPAKTADDLVRYLQRKRAK